MDFKTHFSSILQKSVSNATVALMKNLHVTILRDIFIPLNCLRNRTNIHFQCEIIIDPVDVSVITFCNFVANKDFTV